MPSSPPGFLLEQLFSTSEWGLALENTEVKQDMTLVSKDHPGKGTGMRNPFKDALEGQNTLGHGLVDWEDFPSLNSSIL